MNLLGIVNYLRSNLKVQNSDNQEIQQDPNYLSMSDTDLESYIAIAASKDFADIDLERIPSKAVYPLMLLAKRELFFALASLAAPDTDVSADEGLEVKQDQRFTHYMTLISRIDAEYLEHSEKGGLNNTLTSFNVTLPSRFATQYNYDNGIEPSILLSIDNVFPLGAEISWKAEVGRFNCYKVYVSETLIYDPYDVSNNIQSGAKLVATIQDKNQTRCRISNLEPLKTYHVMISVSDISSLTARDETTFTTLAEV